MKTYTIPYETMTAIKEREFICYNFTMKGRFYPCYSKVMQYLLTDSPVLVNSETNSPEQVERGEVLDIYAAAFDLGRETFRNDIKPDASIDFLIEQYNDYYNGWKRTSEALSLILQKSQVEKMGVAAGVRFEYEIYRQKKRAEFEAVEHKEKPQRLTVKGFKDNIPGRLTKIHTYLSNKNLIDCNRSVITFIRLLNNLLPMDYKLSLINVPIIDALASISIKSGAPRQNRTVIAALQVRCNTIILEELFVYIP